MTVLRKLRYEEAGSSLAPLAGSPQSSTPDDSATPITTYPDAWRAAGLIIGCASVLLLALFYGTAARTVETWYESATYNHGFLILPICGYLVWLRRARIIRVLPESDYRGLVLILACGLGWLIANAAGVLVLQEFALVGMVQSLAFTVLGWRATRTLAFPLFYLLFAVPAGDALIPTMQDWTAWFTVWALDLVGVPVFLDGVFISIPNGNFEVAEACAGVRFLIATVALGFLYAELTYQSIWRRAVFIGLSFVVPVIANWLRAFGIVMIAHLTNNEYAVGVDHLIYGWIFFAIVTVLLLMIGTTFRDESPSETGAAPVPTRTGMRPNLSRYGFAAIAAIAIAVLAPAYAAITDRSVNLQVATLEAPQVGNAWQPVTTREAWRPVFPKASADLFRSYQKSGRLVHLYIAYYANQTRDAEVIGFENTITNGKIWQRASGGTTTGVIDGRSHRWGLTRLLRGNNGRVAMLIYWVDGTFTGNQYYAKALQAKARFLGHSGAAAALVVAADYAAQPAEAEAAIDDFLKSLGPVGPLLARIGKNS